MNIEINIEDTSPIFAQLIEQIKKAILSGGIKPGEPLPSIRQLANDLAINNKTVAKAYRLLERDSVIEAKGYRGTFIHPDAKNNCTVDLSKLVTTKLNEAISSLRESGVTDSEIRIALKKLLNKSNN